MTKRMICIGLLLALAFAFFSCTASSEGETTTKDTSISVETTIAETTSEQTESSIDDTTAMQTTSSVEETTTAIIEDTTTAVTEESTTQTEPTPPEVEMNVVRYRDFGAVGDGKTDDFLAIFDAHRYANKNKIDLMMLE